MLIRCVHEIPIELGGRDLIGGPCSCPFTSTGKKPRGPANLDCELRKHKVSVSESVCEGETSMRAPEDQGWAARGEARGRQPAAGLGNRSPQTSRSWNQKKKKKKKKRKKRKEKKPQHATGPPLLSSGINGLRGRGERSPDKAAPPTPAATSGPRDNRAHTLRGQGGSRAPKLHDRGP